MAQSVLERRTYQPGEVIFSEGEPGDRAYILQSGMIEIVRETGENPVVLGTIPEGGIFGEMALIDNEPRMATARAVTGSTVIVVSRIMFQKKLSKTDPFITGLLKVFAQNLRAISREMR